MKAKHKSLVIILVVSLFLAACGYQPASPSVILPTSIPTEIPENMTATGFYWPTVRSIENSRESSWWLRSGCSWNDEGYFDNSYHIGLDIKATLTTDVKAISSGEIIGVSQDYLNADGTWHSSGWNNDGTHNNKALIIQHWLADGSTFVAVYGHIVPIVTEGEVTPNQTLGKVGNWVNQDHLHLSIYKGDKAKDPYGIMPCPATESTLNPNGTEDPYVWLTTQRPGESALGASATAVPISTKVPAPINTKVAVPVPTPTRAVPKLTSVDVNCEPDPLFFTYDQDDWTVRVNERMDYLPKICHELVLNADNTCVIGQFPGHGAVPVSEETKNYGGISFLVYRWKAQAGTWKAMSVKWDNYQYNFNVDLTDFDSPCWSKVEEVLAASAKLKFKP